MTLTREEAIEILEGIARDGRNAAATIAAIKLLLEMERDEPTPGDEVWDDFERRYPALRVKRDG